MEFGPPPTFYTDLRPCNTLQTPHPGVVAWEVTLSARKVVPGSVRRPATAVLLRTLYSQAQGCVCTARQLGGDVEQPRLMSKYDAIHKTGNT